MLFKVLTGNDYRSEKEGEKKRIFSKFDYIQSYTFHVL